MAVLNINSESLKTRIVKTISSQYDFENTKEATPAPVEAVGDYILLGLFNKNVILKSLVLNSANADGVVGNLVLLSQDKQEIQWEESGTTETLPAIVSSVELGDADVEGKDILPEALKNLTLQKFILSENTERNEFNEPIYLAFKVTTAPAAATSEATLNAEINFIENV